MSNFVTVFDVDAEENLHFEVQESSKSGCTIDSRPLKQIKLDIQETRAVEFKKQEPFSSPISQIPKTEPITSANQVAINEILASFVSCVDNFGQASVNCIANPQRCLLPLPGIHIRKQLLAPQCEIDVIPSLPLKGIDISDTLHCSTTVNSNWIKADFVTMHNPEFHDSVNNVVKPYVVQSFQANSDPTTFSLKFLGLRTISSNQESAFEYGKSVDVDVVSQCGMDPKLFCGFVVVQVRLKYLFLFVVVIRLVL
jgi:hypothetical protein